MCVCKCVGGAHASLSLSLYIYIYIYIYCHPQTDCLVWLNLRDIISWVQNKADFTSIRYLTLQTFLPLDISKGILHIYLFTYTILGYRNAHFLRRALHLCVHGTWKFPTRVLNAHEGTIYIYIYIYTLSSKDTVSLCYDSSV